MELGERTVHNDVHQVACRMVIVTLAMECVHVILDILAHSASQVGGGLISLPNDKSLYWSKLKALADDKTNVTKLFKFVMGRIENN